MAGGEGEQADATEKADWITSQDDVAGLILALGPEHCFYFVCRFHLKF